MDSTTTRRALLGSALLAPIAATAAVLPTVSVSGADWNRKLDEVQRLKAIMTAADERFTRAYDAVQASLPPEPVSAIKRMFPGDRSQYVLHNADIDQLEAELAVCSASTWRDIAVADVEAIKAWRAAYQQAREASGQAALATGVDDAVSAYSDAAHILLETPAPDLASVSWKLDYLFGQDEGSSSSWSLDVIHAVMADVRRLGGEAQA